MGEHFHTALLSNLLLSEGGNDCAVAALAEIFP
jgi:hypothetical protein